LAADASTADVAGSDFFVSLPPHETKVRVANAKVVKNKFFIVKIKSIRLQN
jgi:hypothetical protein